MRREHVFVFLRACYVPGPALGASSNTWKSVLQSECHLIPFIGDELSHIEVSVFPRLPCGFPVGSDGKEAACNARDVGSIPGSGRSPEEGNGYPLQHSCLENSIDGGAWQATVHGVAESDMTGWLTKSHCWSSLLKAYKLSWPCLRQPFSWVDHPQLSATVHSRLPDHLVQSTHLMEEETGADRCKWPRPGGDHRLACLTPQQITFSLIPFLSQPCPSWQSCQPRAPTNHYFSVVRCLLGHCCPLPALRLKDMATFCSPEGHT